MQPGGRAGLFCCLRKKARKTGQAVPMDRIIIFCTGAVASVVSEIFWKGATRVRAALLGGTGMLLLRRIVLRFPYGNHVLLCLFGALLLQALNLLFLLIPALSRRSHGDGPVALTIDLPSFSYGLYRFLLIAPAYIIIKYLEARFGM